MIRPDVEPPPVVKFTVTFWLAPAPRLSEVGDAAHEIVTLDHVHVGTIVNVPVPVPGFRTLNVAAVEVFAGKLASVPASGVTTAAMNVGGFTCRLTDPVSTFVDAPLVTAMRRTRPIPVVALVVQLTLTVVLSSHPSVTLDWLTLHDEMLA
jgi:hypothetical protein